MDRMKELMEKAKAASSVEELIALAAENGITLSPEEGERYFARTHQEKGGSKAGCELADEELDNVAGGSTCEDGRTFSDNEPYYLITTMFNTCSHYKSGQPDKYCLDVCGDCKYSYRYDFTLYCTARTRNNDPYK